MDKIMKSKIHVNWTKKNRNCKTMEKFVEKCLILHKNKCNIYKKILKECKTDKIISPF